MHDRPAGEVTGYLLRWSQGDAGALDRLYPVIEAELRRLARFHLRRERPEFRLQTGELIGEAFLVLIPGGEIEWSCRAQFYGIASKTMRRVLVDHARARCRLKRGSGQPTVVLDQNCENTSVATLSLDEVLWINEALARLEKVDPRLSRTVEMRVFAGMTNNEIAAVEEISVGTVKRDWTIARAWLALELDRR